MSNKSFFKTNRLLDNVMSKEWKFKSICISLGKPSINKTKNFVLRQYYRETSCQLHKEMMTSLGSRQPDRQTNAEMNVYYLAFPEKKVAQWVGGWVGGGQDPVLDNKVVLSVLRNWG